MDRFLTESSGDDNIWESTTGTVKRLKEGMSRIFWWMLFWLAAEQNEKAVGSQVTKEKKQVNWTS